MHAEGCTSLTLNEESQPVDGDRILQNSPKEHFDCGNDAKAFLRRYPAGKCHMETERLKNVGITPSHQIAELDRAPVNAQGKVEFSSDFYILRPRDAARSNGVALVEVYNLQ